MLVRLRRVLRDMERAKRTATPTDDNNAAARLIDLLSQTRARLSELAEMGATTTEQAQADVVARTVRDVERLTAAAFGEVPAGVQVSFRRLPVAALEEFVGLSGDGSPLLDTFRLAVGPLSDELAGVLYGGIAAGQNPRQVAREVSARIGVRRARAESIARTEMIRAYREASRRTYEANSGILEGYVRLCARDSRVCPACWALHGTLYPTSERMPTHANCRCVMVPRTRTLSEITGDEEIPDERPVYEDGETLFARLSNEEQREALGPERYRLYQSGVSLSAMVRVERSKWGPTTRVLPVEQIPTL